MAHLLTSALLLLLASQRWEPSYCAPTVPKIPPNFFDSPISLPVETVTTESESPSDASSVSSYSPEDAYAKFIIDSMDETSGTSPGVSLSPVDSFHLSMIDSLRVESQGQARLSNFLVPGLDEVTAGHYIEANIDPINGVFHPKHSGIYLLSTTVLIELQETSATTEPEQLIDRRRRHATSDVATAVTVSVCIDNKCTDDPALLTTGGLVGVAQTTLSVLGTLQLRTDQSVSVSISNKSSQPLTISNRSSFTAHLLTVIS